MATTEKFIERITESVDKTPGKITRPQCLFFGVSKPFLYCHTRIERQAAVVSYGIGSVVLHRLYVGDTGEHTGMLSSYVDVHSPVALGTAVVLPGLVSSERATIDTAGIVQIWADGELLEPNAYYQAQLNSQLALLTIEC